MIETERLTKKALVLAFALIWIGMGSSCRALPRKPGPIASDQPIVLIAVDKMESSELFASNLPAIRKFLQKSACGLMNVRSGSGYSTESGYLTLGSGNRSISPITQGGAFKPGEPFLQDKAGSFWQWSMAGRLNSENLIIPEIGWLKNTAETEDYPVQPGLLGTIFRSGGWQTLLFGNQDTVNETSRPAGYVIMDRWGIISKGMVSETVNLIDRSFPYFYRFNTESVLGEVAANIKPRSLILIEFGDFARLDKYSDVILPERYVRLKHETWKRLDGMLERLLKVGSENRFRLVLFSPSLSKEGINKKSMLAPVVICAPGFQRGLLTSGTTNWPGLVANIDLLPTLAEMAGLQPIGSFSGRTIRTVPLADHLDKLLKLNARIALQTLSQRSLLECYLWAISIGWIAVALSILLKKSLDNGLLVIGVAVLPLTILLLPLLPPLIWQEGGLFFLTSLIVLVLIKIKELDQRYLLISLALWGGLILDQITGGNLVRFSALGYSAVAGSRYYGIGNEYMGTFLAASLILADLAFKGSNRKWPALLILGMSVFTLGWPQLGINFGGTLAALAGFSFYLAKLYRLDWTKRRIWIACGGSFLIVLLAGWWDSLRDPDSQTHLGRFFQLMINQDLNQIWQIFSRKIEMNSKLLVFSSWTRVILLALGIAIVIRLVSPGKMFADRDRLLWSAMLISGFAALLFNDSGIVAFGTCLAYGFSYFLNCYEKKTFMSSRVVSK